MLRLQARPQPELPPRLFRLGRRDWPVNQPRPNRCPGARVWRSFLYRTSWRSGGRRRCYCSCGRRCRHRLLVSLAWQRTRRGFGLVAFLAAATPAAAAAAGSAAAAAAPAARALRAEMLHSELGRRRRRRRARRLLPRMRQSSLRRGGARGRNCEEETREREPLSASPSLPASFLERGIPFLDKSCLAPFAWFAWSFHSIPRLLPEGI